MEEKATTRLKSPARFIPILACAVIALAACGGGGEAGGDAGGDAPVLPHEPVFTNFQSATTVLGQAGFLSSSENRGQPGPGEATMASPFGITTTPDGMIFVADTNNHRVLAFNGLGENSGVAADFAVGKLSLMDGTILADPAGYEQPLAVSVGKGKLAVVDLKNHRVLIYDTIPTAFGAQPSVVVGQQSILDSDFLTCDDAHLSLPSAAQITPDGKLIVADGGHHRVLIWETVPIRDGQPADVVLGQPDFDSCSEPTVPARNAMRAPQGVWSDGKRLAVSDTFNDRVLLWDELTMEDGQEPVRVLGQQNLDVVEENKDPARTSLATPAGLASDGNRLVVADFGNHRVLIWNTWPTGDAQAADVVLGQPDFTSNDQATASDRSLKQPHGLAFHGDSLLVTDTGNSRVLVFKPN